MTAPEPVDRRTEPDDGFTARLARRTPATPVDIAADVREEAMARAICEADVDVDAVSWAWDGTDKDTRDQYREMARAAISADPGPDTADQLRQRVHDIADELRAPDLIAQLLAEHEFSEHAAGNGYTEPREAWAECSCGVTLFAWQQFYDEGDDRVPHREYAAHIAVLARDLAADRLRTALASSLPDTTKD